MERLTGISGPGGAARERQRQREGLIDDPDVLKLVGRLEYDFHSKLWQARAMLPTLEGGLGASGQAGHPQTSVPVPPSTYDANDLMHVFDTLWLKAGFALHAYEYREGSNGIIWAVPADARLVAPGECPRLEDTWLQPPGPPGAVRLMQAIEGDGSPWSYLSASILRREAEFGAIGTAASGATRLFSPSLRGRLTARMRLADALKLTGDAPAGNWTWHGAVPHTWKPTYADMWERSGGSSCTSIIRSAEKRSTVPGTPIPLAATMARPRPQCCARATGLSSTD